MTYKIVGRIPADSSEIEDFWVCSEKLYFSDISVGWSPSSHSGCCSRERSWSTRKSWL